MNILGPLTNPAGARRQVVGVAEEELLGLIPDALRELGHLRALVVHGQPGMDEVSPIGLTRVAELREGRIERYEIGPSDLGLEPVEAGDLAGGEPEENAAIIEAVLGGEEGAPRSAVVANAAAAILVADLADSWSEAAELARRTLDEGRARAALDALRAASKGAGSKRG